MAKTNWIVNIDGEKVVTNGTYADICAMVNYYKEKGADVDFRAQKYLWLVTDGQRTKEIYGTYYTACKYANTWRKNRKLPWEAVTFRTHKNVPVC